MCTPHDVRRYRTRGLIAPLGDIVGEHANTLVGFGKEDRVKPMADLERPDAFDVLAARLFHCDRGGEFERRRGCSKFKFPIRRRDCSWRFFV